MVLGIVPQRGTADCPVFLQLAVRTPSYTLPESATVYAVGSKVDPSPEASYHGPCSVQRTPYSSVRFFRSFQLSCPYHSNEEERRLPRTSWFTCSYSAKCSVR